MFHKKGALSISQFFLGGRRGGVAGNAKASIPVSVRTVCVFFFFGRRGEEEGKVQGYISLAVGERGRIRAGGCSTFPCFPASTNSISNFRPATLSFPPLIGGIFSKNEKRRQDKSVSSLILSFSIRLEGLVGCPLGPQTPSKDHRKNS